MTCRLHERLMSLTQRASQVSERITIWHPRQGVDCVQVSFCSDPETESGTGKTICEALAELETKLGIVPPGECLECAETDTL
jgi:hypothetical protein